jgi:hypothetical protein
VKSFLIGSTLESLRLEDVLVGRTTIVLIRWCSRSESAAERVFVIEKAYAVAILLVRSSCQF